MVYLSCLSINVWALSDEIKKDMYLLEITEAIKENRWQNAYQSIIKINSLKNIDLPESIKFFYA
jgi:hypothetical protein